MRIGSSARTAVLPLSSIYPSDTLGFGYIPIIMRTDSSGAMAGLCGSNGYQDGFLPVATWSYVFYRTGSDMFVEITHPGALNAYDNPNAANPNLLKWFPGASGGPNPTTFHGIDSMHERIAVRKAWINPDGYDSPILQCGSDVPSYDGYQSWNNSDLADALCITVPLTNTVPALYNKYYDAVKSYTDFNVRVECLVFGRSSSSTVLDEISDYGTRILTTYRESSRGGGLILNAMTVNGMVPLRNGYTFVYGFNGLTPILTRPLASSTSVNRNLDMFILNDSPYVTGSLQAGSRCIAVNIYIGPYYSA